MKKEKKLYSCECMVNAKEYGQMAKYFPKKMYWVLVINGLYKNLILTAIVAILYMNFLITLIFFIISQLLIMIFYKTRLSSLSEKVFRSQLKKRSILTDEVTCQYEFYDDYFIRKEESITLKIDYSEIEKCVETDTNFYLEYGKRNIINIIQKNCCDLDLITFIRGKFSNLENHLGEKQKIKIKKIKNPSFVKKMMIVLFVLTIASLWFAIGMADYVAKLMNIASSEDSKTLWICWVWLPIPIASFYLGYKYQKMGLHCIKNIIAGLIIGMFLLFLGAIGISLTFF